jgi:hypothetical protein
MITMWWFALLERPREMEGAQLREGSEIPQWIYIAKLTRKMRRKIIIVSSISISLSPLPFLAAFIAPRQQRSVLAEWFRA